MMVRCYWCISILIIIPTIRCCSLTGPLCGWSAVVRQLFTTSKQSTAYYSFFTMKIEKDNTIPFLDTSVSRDSNGLLTTTVYRIPTHTDQYLAYDSHHPQSVKRGIVKCLYDRAKHLTSKPSAISKEKKHLSSVLVRTDILLHLYESSQRQQDQQPTKNLRRNLNLLPFYPT